MKFKMLDLSFKGLLNTVSQEFDNEATEEFTVLSQDTQVNQFKIAKRIGVGGMGEVYLAEDTRLNRKIALKFIAPGFCSDQTSIMRFRQEAEAAAQINHPNVVTIYEINEFEDRAYIAMEYISGKSLSEIINLHNLNLEQKIEIIKQICSGLKAAHDKELIHQDLKPGNIMVAPSGRVIILDFGLAQRVRADSVDKKGKIEGTLLYMSPEQVSGAKLNYSTDIFSLGVVLYELVTMQKPFSDIDMNRVVYMILHENPLPPIEIDSSIPEWLNILIIKLLEKDPINRFANIESIQEFIEDSISAKLDQSSISGLKTRNKSVTVIDLKNLSGDESWEYFCTGFTEDLIREISKRTNLIIGSEPVRKTQSDISDIFNRCRTDYVITGDLMKWQDKIRLGLSIYGDQGKKILLGESFSGEAQDLFKILGDASRETAEVLAKASGSSPIAAKNAISTDITAYDYYLKGRNYYHTNKPEDLEFATKMFEKALELDPEFTLAYTGLADVHISYYMSYYDRNPKRMELARLEAEKALKKDTNLSEAHRSLGRYYMFLGEFEKAEKEFKRCIDISPRNFIGYRTLAWLKDWQGDDESAMIWAKRALELAPTDLETLLLISLLYLDMSKYTLSMATLQRAIELGPDYGRAYYMLGAVYLKLGVVDLALENYLLSIKYDGDVNCYIDAGYSYLIMGDFQNAYQKFDESIAKNYLPVIAFYYKGVIKKIANDDQEAHDNFQKSILYADDELKQASENNIFLAYKILSMIMLGQRDEAVKLLNQCSDLCQQQGEGLYMIARIYALLGDMDRSNQNKNMAMEKHAGPSQKELDIDPHFSDQLLNLCGK
jgi:serine/threonine protein kinase/Tfp pilus assembly protein PilF